MIFATVGTQLPFPRLMTILDRAAGELGLEIIAQTCEPLGTYRYLTERESLSPREFDNLIARTDRIVGHAGVGTILSARKAGKPAILFPRRASFGEHRNEHQLATVSSLGRRDGFHIAWHEDELRALITMPSLPAPESDQSPTRAKMIQKLRSFMVS